MAGDWFHLDDDLPDKPEIHNMAARLGVPDADTIVGKCARFWAWVDRHLTTEAIPPPSVTSVTPARDTIAWLDGVVHLPGFSEAMLGVGWLLETPAGLVVPCFEERFSQSAKRRMVASRRQARKRHASVTDVTVKRDECHVPSVTSAVPREEKRERRDEEPPPSPRWGKADAQEVVDRWNAIAGKVEGLSRVQVFSEKAQGRYRAQLKRFPDWWATVEEWLPKIDPSWFKWIDFGWLLSEDNFGKFLGQKDKRYAAPFGANGPRRKTMEEMIMETTLANERRERGEIDLEAEGREAF